MKRRLFTILSALSLLLFVAVVGMWVRSHWTADVVVRHWRSNDGDALHSLMMQSHEGRFAVHYDAWQRGGPPGAQMVHWVDAKPYIDPVASQCTWSVLGIEWHAFDQFGPTVDAWTLVVPIWTVVMPLATGSVLLCSWRIATRRRPRPGLCSSCGYDLRATPGRCPECGRVP